MKKQNIHIYICIYIYIYLFFRIGCWVGRLVWWVGWLDGSVGWLVGWVGWLHGLVGWWVGVGRPSSAGSLFGLIVCGSTACASIYVNTHMKQKCQWIYTRVYKLRNKTSIYVNTHETNMSVHIYTCVHLKKQNIHIYINICTYIYIYLFFGIILMLI